MKIINVGSLFFLQVESHLVFIIYADKTRLSSFGTTMGYPVFVRLGNLPESFRNSRGYAGGRLVGWLPIVCVYSLWCKLLITYLILILGAH